VQDFVDTLYVQHSEFRARSVFQGKSKLLKNPERWKNVHYNAGFSVYTVPSSRGCFDGLIPPNKAASHPKL